MKNTDKFASLSDKKLIKTKEIRGGNAPIDKPKRPTGGLKPPFDRKK